MKTRTTAAALVLVAVLAAGCGTRVDEVATQPTVLVPLGAGSGQVTGADNGAGIDGGAVAGGSIGAGSTGSGGQQSGTGGQATSGGGTGGTAGGSSSGRVATGEPIVLGAVGTRSGLVGAALENGFRGLVVWQEWVNANGGINGRPVRVIIVDDASDPARHASAVRRLILEEGVVAFIGNIAPFTFSAGVPLLEEHGVPALGGDGGEAAWFNSPMAFPINGQTVSRSRPAANWVLANLPQRRAAVIYVNEADAPRQLAVNFADQWRQGGGAVVMEAGVSLATPDFTSEIIRARNEGADLVYTVLEKAACNRFFDAARRQQFRVIFLMAACTIDNARDAADVTTGLMYAVHASRPLVALPGPGGRSPAEAEALEAVSRFDPDLSPDGAFMFGWLAGKLLEEALSLPGAEATPAGIVAALNALPATTLGGLTPSQSWPPGPHPEGRCGLISRFDGENLVLQTPDFVC